MKTNHAIPFNKPTYTGHEDRYVLESLKSSKMSGDGKYTRLCQTWFEKELGCRKALLTPSCTHALEMAAMLIGIGPGDEVIIPSYTFVSTANAFVLRGARIVFIDVRQDTMNIDENKIEAAISSRTKAIVPVHYAGVSCEMDTIMEIAQKHDLFVIEDAAQGMMATYKGRPLGTIGHLGTYSFHETKNYTSAGEGGLLIINDESMVERADIIREKGTNRSKFFRGMVDKYTWIDVGSSYLLNDVSAAYLYGQLEQAHEIFDDRMASWDAYYEALAPFAITGALDLPGHPQYCSHNAHMFYVKVGDLESRGKLIRNLQENGIMSVFHYVPLHSSPAGARFGCFFGRDIFTTKESERLARLPLFYGLKRETIANIASHVIRFIQS